MVLLRVVRRRWVRSVGVLLAMAMPGVVQTRTRAEPPPDTRPFTGPPTAFAPTTIATTAPTATSAVIARPDLERLSLPALVKRASPGVVTVVAFNPDLAMPGIGMGFFAAADQVITARHVLARVTRAEIRTRSGGVYRIAGIIAAEGTADLVLVKLDKPVPDAVVPGIAGTLPEPGERLFAISSPLGLEWSVSDGVASAIRSVKDVGDLLQHSVSVSIGSSGCPLFNYRGEVVAVQTATLTVGPKTVSAGQGLNFASPAQRAAHFTPGPLRTLADCVSDLPKDWVPAITRGIDALSLHSLTKDDFQSSLTFFEEEVRRDPDEADGWFRLAICRERTGDRAGAITGYQKSIALAPSASLPYNNLGVIYLQQGDYAKAVEYLQHATAARQDYCEAFGSLAAAEYHLKHYPEAIAAAQKSLSIDPTHAEPHLTLGCALLESGDRAKADEQYKALLNLDKPKAEQLQKLMNP